MLREMRERLKTGILSNNMMRIVVKGWEWVGGFGVRDIDPRSGTLLNGVVMTV
jgi:hypothetical protein